jgi:hypothetical protein
MIGADNVYRYCSGDVVLGIFGDFVSEFNSKGNSYRVNKSAIVDP